MSRWCAGAPSSRMPAPKKESSRCVRRSSSARRSLSARFASACGVRRPSGTATLGATVGAAAAARCAAEACAGVASCARWAGLGGVGRAPRPPVALSAAVESTCAAPRAGVAVVRCTDLGGSRGSGCGCSRLTGSSGRCAPVAWASRQDAGGCRGCGAPGSALTSGSARVGSAPPTAAARGGGSGARGVGAGAHGVWAGARARSPVCRKGGRGSGSWAGGVIVWRGAPAEALLSAR